MTTKTTSSKIFLAALAAIFLVACGVSGSVPEGRPAGSPEEVSVQLSWLHNIEFAGFYVAEADGYYADENLEVDLRPGGLDTEGNFTDPIQQVVSGAADFGDIDGPSIVKARAEGAPVVAIASIYQLPPTSLTSLAEKNIVRPADLVGSTIQITDNSLLVFEALLTSQGIDPAEVNVVPRTDFSPTPLVSGETDVLATWVTNENVDLTMDDVAFNAILPSDYGIEVYPNAIFTSEDMVANHPDLVERFLRATVKGMQGVADDPEHATEVTLTYNDSLSLEKETEAMFQSLPLINPAGSQPGMMKGDTWALTQQIMLDQGLLDAPIDVEKTYTLEFLNRVYGQ